MPLHLRAAATLAAIIAASSFAGARAHADTASPAPMPHMAMPAASPTASPTPVPTPDATEAMFISAVGMTLQQRYATTAAASAAGYFQMTRLEDDGTIIWFNGKWDDQVRPDQPNFLWYDKNGALVGLDYEYQVSTHPKPPASTLYPVMPSRWTTIDAHIHFAYKLPDGTIKRRGAETIKGVEGDPTAAQLTAAKLLPPGATLLWSHYHPKSWDLGFWLVPNPNGAFADLNPNVKP